ncbi:MAG: UDP-N-acetylmuramoyl-L-alanine--D-glutamate ligase [Verrucomicrobiae bacterium]|nr:UDP-N-acetylmuramoyl-L-alanine--D-glutamate ligase [Verrucomicrobiae bacterium]
MNYHNQQIAVLGAGTSGVAAAQHLVTRGARVTVQDQGVRPLAAQATVSLQALGCEIQKGETLEADARFSLAVISPGIDPRQEWVQSYFRLGIPVWSELELGYRAAQCPVVAITGTNGKTTTTELTQRVAAAAGLRSVAAGNIGLPLSEAVDLNPEAELFVLEVSSYQLEHIHEFRARVAVMLNLTPDHFDRYRGLADYAAAKNRIFENQRPDDTAVVQAEYAYKPGFRGQVTRFTTGTGAADYVCREGVIFRGGREVLRMEECRLKGIHNAENLMAVLALAGAMHWEETRTLAALKSYEPAPHRCEIVGVVGGVTWINDSKATNTDAVEKALLSQPRPVLLIAGGKDKGFPFESLVPVVKEKVRRAFLIGETAPKIAQAWAGGIPCEQSGTLEAAVAAAAQHAREGDIVLLSPACSSFDQFRDYADRGEQFKNFVRALEDPNGSQTHNNRS